MSETRLIVEQFDPELPKPGGIDTCIRGLIQYAPEAMDVRVVGVDALGTRALGTWTQETVRGRTFWFLPVARVDHSNLTRRLPHSLRMSWGLLRYRSKIPRGVTIQTHRVNLGWLVAKVFPHAKAYVQLLHSSGTHDLKSGSQSFFKYGRFVYRFLETSVVRRSVKTVIFSSEGAVRLKKISDRVEFSPTWFDPAQFYPAPDSGRTRTRLLWACRLEPSKNPELAIEAMAHTSPDVALTIAGSGTAREDSEARVRELGLTDRVAFVGAVPKEEMGDCMRDHDALLMTSLFEGFSRSIVEALACGLPIITTPGGEPNGLVVDGLNGFRISYEDPADLAAAMKRMPDVTKAACVASVAMLSAADVVPSVLRLPGDREPS
jgi:glycosyltransferase involved in cell wall biosynthesis